MSYRISQVEVPRYPVVRVTFDDGLAGELDLSGQIERAPMFAPLRDAARFRNVALAPGGRRFGWQLDQPGREIDFDAEAARITIETEAVERLADAFAARRPAAE